MNDPLADSSCSAKQRSTAEKSSEDAFDGGLPTFSAATFWPTNWRARLIFIPSAAAIIAVRCYQKILSPILGRTCRFHPSCSQYYILAVQKHGLLRGSWRGVCRIARCHPWHPGGYDPP